MEYHAWKTVTYRATMPRSSSVTSKRISLWACRKPTLRHGMGDVNIPLETFDTAEPRERLVREERVDVHTHLQSAPRMGWSQGKREALSKGKVGE